MPSLDITLPMPMIQWRKAFSKRCVYLIQRVHFIDKLVKYLEQGSSIPITIHGDSNSAQFESLVPALEQTGLSSAVPGISARIVTKINVYLSVWLFIVFLTLTHRAFSSLALWLLVK